MKKLQSIFTLFFLTMAVQMMTAQEMNYLEILDPIYLTQETQSTILISSYEQLNQQLIKKGTFNFSREIKTARKNNELLIVNGTENALSLEKSQYLKMLRKAANRSENVSEFYNYLSDYLPVFDKTYITDGTLFKLFDVSRRNSTNGKLDIISGDLTWL